MTITIFSYAILHLFSRFCFICSKFSSKTGTWISICTHLERAKRTYSLVVKMDATTLLPLSWVPFCTGKTWAMALSSHHVGCTTFPNIQQRQETASDGSQTSKVSGEKRSGWMGWTQYNDCDFHKRKGKLQTKIGKFAFLKLPVAKNATAKTKHKNTSSRFKERLHVLGKHTFVRFCSMVFGRVS